MYSCPANHTGVISTTGDLQPVGSSGADGTSHEGWQQGGHTPMSPRLLRLDSPRLDALVFRADSVRFEACATFRGGVDAAVCECGWLEADHAAGAGRRQFRGRRPARRLHPTAVRDTA
jgi:hypothetical protein